MTPAAAITAVPESGGAAIPRHVAIIMDGNGRWAKARHLPRAVGHQRGVEAVRKLVRALKDTEIADHVSVPSPRSTASFALNDPATRASSSLPRA